MHNMVSIFKNSMQAFNAVKANHLTGACSLSFKGCYLPVS